MGVVVSVIVGVNDGRKNGNVLVTVAVFVWVGGCRVLVTTKVGVTEEEVGDATTASNAREIGTQKMNNSNTTDKDVRRKTEKKIHQLELLPFFLGG